MSDELRTVLRLVADGHLTAEEAAPIIEALSGKRDAAYAPLPPRAEPGGSGDERAGGRPGGRQLRIRVTEHGRQVVNLRIPLALADSALRMVPGLGDEQGRRIRAAIDEGALGPIVDVEDESGDGVLITLE